MQFTVIELSAIKDELRYGISRLGEMLEEWAETEAELPEHEWCHTREEREGFDEHLAAMKSALAKIC